MPYSRTVTLTAGQVSTITETAETSNLEVVSLDGAAAIYFTTGDANVSAPTVDGDNTYVLPAAIGGLELPLDGSKVTTVKLISSGTPKVHVRFW